MEENKNITDSNETTTNIFEEIFQWVNAVLLALVIALFIRGFIFEPVMVVGNSMNDTLHDKQRLIVYKLGTYFNTPERGDIVVLQYQASVFYNLKYLDDNPIFRRAFPDFKEINYIKRTIGLPGDTIDIRNGKVYVNGKMLDEPYAKGETYPAGMTFPVTVPENNVFVLGDNRENSSDSRYIGFVKISKIKGKAVYRVYPFDVFGAIK